MHFEANAWCSCGAALCSACLLPTGPSQRLLAVDAQAGVVAVAHNFADHRGGVTLHDPSLDPARRTRVLEYGSLRIADTPSFAGNVVALDVRFLGAL